MTLNKLILALLCLFIAGEAYSYEDIGPACRDRADSLRTQAAELKKAGQYDRAARLDSISAAIYKNCGDSLEEGRALERTGFSLWRMGRLGPSLEYYMRARRIYADYGNPRDMASILNRLGLVHWRLDDADSALKMFGEVVKLGTELGDSSLIAKGSGNAGMVYRHLGRHREAMENYDLCLAIYRMTGDEKKQAFALGNIGVLYSSRGQYREALLCFQEALSLSRKVGDARTESRVLGNLGNVYYNLRQFDDAHDLYTRQLENARLLQNKLDEATCLDNLGNLQWAMGNFEEALKTYREALSLYKSIGNRRNEGIIAYDIAQVYISMDNFQEASGWIERALKIHREVGDVWSEASDLTASGDINLALGNVDEASHAFDRAMALTGENECFEVSWYSLYGQARVRRACGDLEGAIALCRESIRGIESIRSEINLESLSTGFFQDRIEPYIALVCLLIEKGEIEEAFRVSESAHARTLLEVMYSSTAGQKEDLPEELVRKRSALESEINRLDRTLLGLYSKAGPDFDSEKARRVEEDLLGARRRYEELCREVDVRLAGLRETGASVEPVGVGELRSTVLAGDENAAILEYLSGEDVLICFVVAEDTLIAKVLDVRGDDLKSLAEEFRRPFTELESGIVDLANLDFSVTSSRSLYDALIRPVEEVLANYPVIIVVADAALHYVPFEALIAGEADGQGESVEGDLLFSGYRDYDYLLKTHVITYVPSASILHELQKRKIRRRIEGELYAVGDPFLGDEKMLFPYVGEILGVLRGESMFRFTRLPGARQEVREIGELFEDAKNVVVTGTEASEKKFKREAPGYRLIHLATHGVADDREPLYSKLLLGVDEGEEEDGFLHAYEVSRMNLNCELVVLSACETAIGPLSKGEGLLGLSRSFLHAGSSSVVASLWSVDESTQFIMTEFYRHLDDGKARALRKAKLKALELERGGMSLAHPFFWAPFVVIGDWK